MEIRRRFPVKVWKPHSAFPTLIHTILSQNTNDRNSDKAMRELRKCYRISPSSLANADIEQLIHCIRSAGIYRSKAAHIREASTIIQNKFGGRLTGILNLPYQQAKQELTALPGVGPKTADILLAFISHRPVIPVDTHVERVSKRLGIASAHAGYEEVRRNLESLIPPRQRLLLHLSIIEFGRRICKAPTPRCDICPVNKTCPSSMTHIRPSTTLFSRM